MTVDYVLVFYTYFLMITWKTQLKSAYQNTTVENEYFCASGWLVSASVSEGTFGWWLETWHAPEVEEIVHGGRIKSNGMWRAGYQVCVRLSKLSNRKMDLLTNTFLLRTTTTLITTGKEGEGECEGVGWSRDLLLGAVLADGVTDDMHTRGNAPHRNTRSPLSTDPCGGLLAGIIGAIYGSHYCCPHRHCFQFQKWQLALG